MGSEQIVITVINQRDKAALPAVHKYYTNNNDRPLALKSMKCKGSNSPRKWEGIQLKSFAEENSYGKATLCLAGIFPWHFCSCIFLVHASSHYLSFLFRPGQGCQKYHSWFGIRANAQGSFTPPILQKNPNFGGGSFEQEGERWE